MSEIQSYIWPNLSGGPVTTDKQGIDYIIVLPDQMSLDAYFFEDVPARDYKSIFRIEGGERITSISIKEAFKTDNNKITITLNRFGDWAPYRLVISESAWEELDIDPVFSWIRFSFKVNCPKTIDCKPHLQGFEKFPDISNFDYQAKDFESFKQAMLDRLPSTIPDWWDRAEADFGITIVDVLAYVGDRLSYYQDRVAAESQLISARARQSVSGHLKLLDYDLYPGETAMAYAHFEVDRDMTMPNGTEVETPALSYETPITFTLKEPFLSYKDLNELIPYDFSHPSLVIPRGALQVAVVGYIKGLKKGSHIIIEQCNDESLQQCKQNEKTKWKRHLIKLLKNPVHKDASDGSKITILSWDDSHALPWDLFLSKSRILGNVVKLYHGRSYSMQPFYVDGVLEYYNLLEGPLGYQKGHPMITLKIDGEPWDRVVSLKESRPYNKHYQVVDLDNGKNRILFGNNENGLRPEKYSMIEIEYHVGLGISGNVAAETLTRLAGKENGEKIKGIKSVSNPFAGENGRDPETEERGKLWGPKLIREQKRAVTQDDYAREALAVPGVSRAIARLVWTGSWITVRVTIDPEGTEELRDELRTKVFEHLISRKMAGYDIQIFPARYVPLEIKIRFCLKDTAFRDQVFRDLNSSIGNAAGADGVKGFFHPDNWTFGQNVQLSELYTALARVQGIECAEVLTFKRLRKPQGDELEHGKIPIQWDEIARMENDRNFPEHGELDLQLVGGR